MLLAVFCKKNNDLFAKVSSNCLFIALGLIVVFIILLVLKGAAE
jgi:hypothetical protein